MRGAFDKYTELQTARTEMDRLVGSFAPDDLNRYRELVRLELVLAALTRTPLEDVPFTLGESRPTRPD